MKDKSRDRRRVLETPPATKRQLQTFHSADYIDFLQANNECDQDDLSDEAKQFGLGQLLISVIFFLLFLFFFFTSNE